jgi:ABC-2 type transport system ATP-binding protein
LNPSLLEISAIRKAYGSLVAVDGVSFAVQRGECLGLLGPNGAGKTTTLAIMAGVLKPDTGQVLIDGRALAGDTDPLKNQLGLVPQDLAFYGALSARDNLAFFGALYNLRPAILRKRIAGALEIVGLSERAKDKANTFSGGMKRRLNLAAALLHDPQLLLLDEPTVGVDPQSRNAIFDNLAALRARGKTILYTTHYMEEVERLCQRVVIMDHGRIIALDTVDALRRRAGISNCLKVELADCHGTEWLPALRRVAGVRSAELDGAQLSVLVDDPAAGIPAVVSFLEQHRQHIAHISSNRPNLESVFLSLTGRTLRDS